MLPRNPIAVFLCWFFLIYGLLLVPWPGWNGTYGDYFKVLGETVFSRDGEKLIVRFAVHPTTHGFTSLQVQMTLGNRDTMDSSGRGLAEVVDLDVRSIGWVPTALTMALILATPIPWRRRLMALVAGLVLVHIFILFAIQTSIWEEYPNLSLATYSPWEREIVDGLNYTLITQMGASFSVPVLIWILVTFCTKDAALFSSRSAAQPDRPPPKGAVPK